MRYKFSCRCGFEKVYHVDYKKSVPHKIKCPVCEKKIIRGDKLEVISAVKKRNC